LSSNAADLRRNQSSVYQWLATTLGILATLGELLVDIHGPHDHQSLLDPGSNLKLSIGLAVLSRNGSSLAVLSSTTVICSTKSQPHWWMRKLRAAARSAPFSGSRDFRSQSPGGEERPKLSRSTPRHECRAPPGTQPAGFGNHCGRRQFNLSEAALWGVFCMSFPVWIQPPPWSRKFTPVPGDSG